MTLIELMVATAIIAILAAIAYPSYQNYVGRTHRSAAVACLSQYSQFMERYYTTNLTYATVPATTLPCTTENGLNRRYTIVIAPAPNAPTASTYVVTATPTTLQQRVDGQCGTLSLDQTGRRFVSGTAVVDRCW